MKENQNKTLNKLSVLFFLLGILVYIVPLNSLAQEQSPLPGNSTSESTAPSNPESAPVPGDTQLNRESTIAPGAVSNSQPGIALPQGSSSAPVSLTALQSLVHELKNGHTSITEENLNKHLIWLDTLIKAHNKLAATFAKQENTQAASNNERNLSKQLYQLKDQVLYIKAQLLIKENRWPEAINILVDIIAFEPQSPLGQQAYKCLIEAGFSPDTARQISTRLPKINSSRTTHRPI